MYTLFYLLAVCVSLLYAQLCTDSTTVVNYKDGNIYYPTWNFVHSDRLETGETCTVYDSRSNLWFNLTSVTNVVSAIFQVTVKNVVQSPSCNGATAGFTTHYIPSSGTSNPYSETGTPAPPHDAIQSGILFGTSPSILLSAVNQTYTFNATVLVQNAITAGNTDFWLMLVYVMTGYDGFCGVNPDCAPTVFYYSRSAPVFSQPVTNT